MISNKFCIPTNNSTSSEDIFRKASKTFYTATKFFPKIIKQDVTDFYAFVRIPDNFIDSTTPDFDAFKKYKENVKRAFNGEITGVTEIDNFIKICKKRRIKKEWIDAFFTAMESDQSIKKYETYADLEKYIYGSAEVIGLVMTRLMDLPTELDSYARLLGKSMQIANFIRDIPEDLSFSRTYIPQEDLRKFGVDNLMLPKTQEQIAHFINLVRFEISRYREIVRQADPGIRKLPKNYRVPVKTASDMYSWSMDIIAKNPLIIFEKKVKPSIPRIILKGLFNLVS